MTYTGRHRAPELHLATAYQLPGGAWAWRCLCGAGRPVRERLPRWVSPELSATRSAAGHTGAANHPRRSYRRKITTPLAT